MKTLFFKEWDVTNLTIYGMEKLKFLKSFGKVAIFLLYIDKKISCVKEFVSPLGFWGLLWSFCFGLELGILAKIFKWVEQYFDNNSFENFQNIKKKMKRKKRSSFIIFFFEIFKTIFVTKYSTCYFSSTLQN